MASYFELPPQQKAGASNIEALPEDERQQLGRMSLLSPAVTQLLDDLGQDPSDSESEESSHSEENHKHLGVLTKKKEAEKSRQDKASHTQPSTRSPLSPRKVDHSPNKKSARVQSPPGGAGQGGPSKQKPPHIARFHSLRSMLFSNTIEGKIKTITQEDCAKEEESANKWKAQHAQRQMHTRPKTLEKDVQGKEAKGAGLGSRLKMSLRRITTKDVPTMETLKEDGAAHDFSDNASTASSDNEDQPYRWKPREADEESINHSDVEDLVRWVSRRDPPSDGEARATGKTQKVSESKDDGHDSMANSDVDELVRWVSKKSSGPQTRQNAHTGYYSDASTESDSEMPLVHDSSDEEDAEELVRWISHREGPAAGPQRKKDDRGSKISQQDSHPRHDSDVPELGDWNNRSEGSNAESGASQPALDVTEEPERGRPRSREAPLRPQARTHLTHDDVNDLVSWISRKNTNQEISPHQDNESETVKTKDVATNRTSAALDTEAGAIEASEDIKKQQLGMSIDEGSLSHSDVKDLLRHVKTSNLTLQGTDSAETGDLRALRTNEREAEKFAAQDYLKENRGESTQIEKTDFMTGQTGGEKKGNKHKDSLGH